MNRQHHKFEMESANELTPHLDAAPGTAPHRKRYAKPAAPPPPPEANFAAKEEKSGETTQKNA